MTMTAQPVARTGWVTFAAILMFAVAGARVISAISYFADSNKVANLSGGLFGDSIWAWGLWDLGVAALAFFAAYSLLSGGGFGRLVAYIWAIVVIIQAFSYINLAPWYAFAAMGLAVFVIYGLAVSPRQSESM
jgi:hypothetical protein